jgi:DNA invertase Pin-like site-specific DNA recombinase
MKTRRGGDKLPAEVGIRRAYSYLRFSHPNQMRGDSRRRQYAFAEEVVREFGAVLDTSLTLQDLGVSAYRGKNAQFGALAKFIEAVRSGRVSRGSILIIENIDRLSRNKVGEALKLFIELLTLGITIVTAEPRRTYTEDSINDVAGILEPIVYMSRAHEESKMKSVRVGEAWAEKKKKAAEEGKPMGRSIPRWVELVDGKFRLMPERAETVRAIFRMAREGLGYVRIMQELQADPNRYPPFNRSGKWNWRYVNEILINRACLGEHQCLKRDDDGVDRLDKVIPGYYPAVVTEEEFYQAHAAIASRRKVKQGRPGYEEANLFTGMVHHAIDKATMFVRSGSHGAGTKRYVYLMSKAWEYGSSARGRAFPYQLFEDAVLRAVVTLRPADVLDTARRGDDREDKISQLTDTVRAYDQKLKMLQEKVADPDTEPEAVPSILKAMEPVAAAKAAKERELKLLKEESANIRSETLGEVQSLVKLVKQAEGPALLRLRRRIKAQLKFLVESVWVYIEKINHIRSVAHIQVFLSNGRKLYLQAVAPALTASAGKVQLGKLNLADVDLRTFDAQAAAAPAISGLRTDRRSANAAS